MDLRLDKLNKFVLSSYLIITFALFLSYIFRFGRGDYNFSEYFVNYSSGFVRRGLPGEIFLSISGISRQDIFVTLLAIHLFALAANYLLIYNISKKIGLSQFKVIILVMHPSLAGYYSWSYSNAFKKDIFLQTFILLVTYLFLLYFEKNNINKLINLLTVSLITMPFIMLVHEIIFLISAAIYLVTFYRIFLNSELSSHIKRYRLKLTIFLTLLLLNGSLFFALTLVKTEYDPVKTFQAVNKFMPLSYGPFPPLTNNTQFYSNPVILKLQNTENLATYLIGFFIIISIFYFTLCLKQQRNFLNLLLLNCPIFLFALIFSDWDRIIVFWSFSFFCTYCIYTFSSKNKSTKLDEERRLSFLGLMLTYLPWLPGLCIFLIIRVPTGNPARFEEISMFWLLLENIAEHLNI